MGQAGAWVRIRRPGTGVDFRSCPVHTCMVQATVCTMEDDELSGALYAVVLRLSRLPVDEPVDKAGLAVLHETRRLGMVRPSDLAAQMRLDLSTISRHLRSLEQQGMVARTADPDDARAQRIAITARGVDVLARLMDHRAATRSPTGRRTTGAPCASSCAGWPTICPGPRRTHVPRPTNLHEPNR